MHEVKVSLKILCPVTGWLLDEIQTRLSLVLGTISTLLLCLNEAKFSRIEFTTRTVFKTENQNGSLWIGLLVDFQFLCVIIGLHDTGCEMN